MREVEIQKNTRSPTNLTHHLAIPLKILGTHCLNPNINKWVWMGFSVKCYLAYFFLCLLLKFVKL